MDENDELDNGLPITWSSLNITLWKTMLKAFINVFTCNTTQLEWTSKAIIIACTTILDPFLTTMPNWEGDNEPKINFKIENTKSYSPIDIWPHPLWWSMLPKGLAIVKVKWPWRCDLT
jgi:hypothetical protein